MSSGGGIGRASLFLASGTIVSRILGFVKTIFLASAVGLIGAPSADAFAVANQLPNTVYVIVAGGVLSAVLVPQIVRAGLHADGGKSYINKLLTIALVILAATTALAVAAAPLLTWLYGSQLDPDTLALAIAFAYWCLPQIFFYGLYTLLGEVLNARKYFGPFTWVPVLNNVVAIAGIAAVIAIYGGADVSTAAQDWTPDMVALLGGTATLGVVLQAVVLFWFWKRIGLSFRPDFKWRGVGLGAAGNMASWTFGMLLLSTIAGIVESNVASIASDNNGNASVAALGTAWLIFMLPHSVITVSIATAYFTRMSEHASYQRFDAVRSDVSSAIRGISLLVVLAAAVLLVCAYPFAAVYSPGNFADISAFGNVVIAYVIGLVGFSVLFVVQRAFYALSDTRTPFFFTLFQVVLFSGGAIISAGLPHDQIAIGIALTTTIAGTVQLLLAAYLLRRRLAGIDGRRIVGSLGRYFFAAALPLLVGSGWLVLLGGTDAGGFALSGRIEAMVSMVIIGVIMTALYFAILLLMRSRELLGFLDPLLARIRRR